MKNSIFTILIISFLAFPEYAFAQTSIEGGAQWVLDLLTGNIARIIAIIGVVLIGYGAIVGRFDMMRAAMVVIGIVIIFGAAEIVDQISG